MIKIYLLTAATGLNLVLFVLSIVSLKHKEELELLEIKREKNDAVAETDSTLWKLSWGYNEQFREAIRYSSEANV